MHVERDPALELSRSLRLDGVPPGGISLDIGATDAERLALARRFQLLDLPELLALVTLRPEGAGLWRVHGSLRARVVQACGITLEPVEQRIDEAFELHFTSQAEPVDRDSGELVVGMEEAEPIDGDTLDLGGIVADQLGLAIDPFPRKPGARLDDILPPARGPSPDEGPFAALARLKQARKDPA